MLSWRELVSPLVIGPMAQHFLLSAAARSLSLAKVTCLSDAGVEEVFLRLRWPETDGKGTVARLGV